MRTNKVSEHEWIPNLKLNVLHHNENNDRNKID